jgi:hypothetical protein
MYRVRERRVEGRSISYVISEDGQGIVGVATVRYDQIGMVWKYVSPAGTLITDFAVRREMDRAIEQLNKPR